MLRESNRAAVECLTSKLDEHVLDGNADNHDNCEVGISEEIRERINRTVAEISAIEFVKELEHDESMEEDGHVSCVLGAVFVFVQMLEGGHVEYVISVDHNK